MEILTTILTWIGYIVVLAIGIVAHFLKKKVKGQTLADVKHYFQSNFVNTVTSIVGAIAGFIILVATGGVSWYAVFTTGYLADSIFNKADEQKAAELKKIKESNNG